MSFVPHQQGSCRKTLLAATLIPDSCLLASIDDLLHPANLTALQAHFNPVGVMSRIRQNLFDDAACPPPAALILFRNDIDLQSRSYVLPVLPVHGSTPLNREKETAGA
jgi:hypothetical protein